MPTLVFYSKFTRFVINFTVQYENQLNRMSRMLNSSKLSMHHLTTTFKDLIDSGDPRKIKNSTYKKNYSL